MPPSYAEMAKNLKTQIKELQVDVSTNEGGLGTMATQNVDSLPSVTFADGANIAVSEDKGTQIATAPAQKLGFYGADPVAQPDTTGTLIGFDPGVGDRVLQDSTFTGNNGSAGYTIGDIVGHLKALGLLKI